MKLKPINFIEKNCPESIKIFLEGATLFDSSSSPEAKVIFIDKDDGYFLKYTAEHSLKREAVMTKYMHSIGLSPMVISYISQDGRDWLITAKADGADCISDRYLSNPVRLADTTGQLLRQLHEMSCTDCPVPNHTELYLQRALDNYKTGHYDHNFVPDSWGYSSANEAIDIINNCSSLLKDEVLLHGDYCLPNIILKDWQFSSFIDVDCGGIGDRHVDLFWGAWTLQYNLHTDKYRERFFDAYGRDKIDKEKFALIRAIEVFG